MNRPERLYNVSHTQLSVARHFGGCTFSGAHYHYDAETDTLIRADIWKAELEEDKEKAKAVAKAEREKWEAVKKSFVGFDF